MVAKFLVNIFWLITLISQMSKNECSEEFELVIYLLSIPLRPTVI
jgi:hypothetical protein